jgi:alkylation response protein AidB-like acyl-CoA dehydrogenase
MRTDTLLRSQLEQQVVEGLTDLGLPSSARSLTEQTEVIFEVAQSSLANAFSLWSHRMTTEYLERHQVSELVIGYLADLKSANRIGSTALATALVDASGRGELPSTFEEINEKIVVNGTIPWASNLYPDTVIVFAARNALGSRIVLTTEIGTPGISFVRDEELLGLNETFSGSIRLANVQLQADNVLSRSLPDFLGLMRPRFLSLQTAFCLGVSAASLASLKASKLSDVFRHEIATYDEQYEGLALQLRELSAALSNQGELVEHRPYLQLRLSAALIAQQVTRLELAAIGGSGYRNGSDTARRVHEALFFSVQAPTEGALKWELSQLK